MLEVIARGYFLSFTFNGLNYTYANANQNGTVAGGWPDWPTGDPDIVLQAGTFYFSTIDNCMLWDCYKSYMPTEKIIGNFQFGIATPECGCTSEDDLCSEYIVTINGQEFKGQLYNGYSAFPLLPFPIELIFS